MAISSTKLLNAVSYKQILTLFSEKQIMRLVGEMVVNSEGRQDPTQAAILEKEGEFNLESEMAEIEEMMKQMHGPDTPQAIPQKQSMTKADKKRGSRKK